MSKTRKDRLPKRIAGVKVPKAVRKGPFGEVLACQVLASDTGQALIAEAVTALGELAAAGKANAGSTARRAPVRTKDKAPSGEQDAASTLTFALGEAVRSFSEALHRGPQASRKPAADGPAWAPADSAPAAKRQKPDATRTIRPTDTAPA